MTTRSIDFVVRNVDFTILSAGCMLCYPLPRKDGLVKSYCHSIDKVALQRTTAHVECPNPIIPDIQKHRWDHRDAQKH